MAASAKPARPCPICGKPSHPEFSPFCSARCQDVDLNRWLSGSYAIPVKDEPEIDEETGAIPSDDGEDEET